MATEQRTISLTNAPTDDATSEDNSLISFGAGGAAPSATTYFDMIGWNTALVDWETWQSTGTPNTTPPVGPCTGIRVSASWTA